MAEEQGQPEVVVALGYISQHVGKRQDELTVFSILDMLNVWVCVEVVT